MTERPLFLCRKIAVDIGIIGYGTIGRSLALGSLKNPRIGRIAATTRARERRFDDISEVVMLDDNREIASISDVIVFCVKPAQLEDVVCDVAREIREGTLLISVAAGVSSKALYRWTGGRFPVIRAMPNTPCSIGLGITALAAAFSLATDQHMALARDLFLALGRVVVVEEPQMDAVTALSGCGPAYVYLIIEALSDAGVSLGLSRAVSLELAAQTLQGAAKLVLDSGSHPAALKDAVTTPGGCTIDGLLALERGLLRSTLVQAVYAASVRSTEIARHFR